MGQPPPSFTSVTHLSWCSASSCSQVQSVSWPASGLCGKFTAGSKWISSDLRDGLNIHTALNMQPHRGLSTHTHTQPHQGFIPISICSNQRLIDLLESEIILSHLAAISARIPEAAL